jgi:hypothetical protein
MVGKTKKILGQEIEEVKKSLERNSFREKRNISEKKEG